MAEPARNIHDSLTIKGDPDLGPFSVLVGAPADDVVLSGQGRATRTFAVGASVVDIPVLSHVMKITAASGETIATISGGYDGMELSLIFLDTNTTITDTATEAADTVNLSAAFTGADGGVLKLLYDGTSWREISRSVNG